MRSPVSEQKLSALEARIENLPGRDSRIPTAEQERVMDRYVKILMKGLPLPRILRRQVRKLCQDQEPPSHALRAMYEEVIADGEEPQPGPRSGKV